MLTVPDLQPQKGDKAPTLRCLEIDRGKDPGEPHLAVFRCGRCNWWDNVEFDDDSSPGAVRSEALNRHKRSGPCR